jgi:hypothetical protein
MDLTTLEMGTIVSATRYGRRAYRFEGMAPCTHPDDQCVWLRSVKKGAGEAWVWDEKDGWKAALASELTPYEPKYARKSGRGSRPRGTADTSDPSPDATA